VLPCVAYNLETPAAWCNWKHKLNLGL